MQEVLSHIREEEVARLACDLVDVPSPTGRERAVGEFVREWLDAHGIEARLQDLLYAATALDLCNRDRV